AGLDPSNGTILWAHPHDPGNDLNCGTPLFGPDNVLFMSSAYQAGSRAVRLTARGDATDTEELWFTNRVRFMFLSSIRIGDFVYGTTGDFGPAFLTALNIKTGESPWQVRGFARASLVAADGKVIVMNEDGDLALARLSATGAEILSRTKVFDTTTWTAPTLVGTTLYARDREKIVALDLGAKSGTPAATPAAPPARTPSTVRAGSVPVPSKPADFSGSWKLDSSASTVAAGAGLAGLHPNGAPAWVFVTQPANGTILMESATNASQSRFYRPGKPTTTATAGGTITMTAAWSGKTLVAEGQLTASGGAVTAVKETISRSEEALVIEIAVGDKISRLRYVRLTDTGACEQWPNPCKKAPGL
ncbi:MAG TPA: hypothetical protein VMS54_10725, partial [Vicinamibacterales bacterium]|nr:hypothetical protein [Vicinamibacterales bacterium]